MSCIDDDLWEFPDKDFAWLVDPRDEILAMLDHTHPDPVDLGSMAGGCFDLPTGIDQLAVAELIESGLVREATDGALSFTEAGCNHVKSRLAKRVGWADYCTRPDAKPNPPVGRRLAMAILHHIERSPDDFWTPKFRDLGDLIPGLYKNEQGFWVLKA